MPTYEYRCKACGEELEVVQSFTDDALTDCPACGAAGELKKVFGNIGITFKGSGFYKTDSRGAPAKAGAPSESSSSSDSKSSDAKSSDSKSGESKTSDKKADAKPSGTKSDTGSPKSSPTAAAS